MQTAQSALLDLEYVSPAGTTKTVRGFLCTVLARLWTEQDDFTFKRALGYSHWQRELIAPLVAIGALADVAEDHPDREGALIEQQAQLEQLIAALIPLMAGSASQIPGLSGIATVDHYEEPPLSRAGARMLIYAQPPAISHGLRERMNAVLGAAAPAPFSDALGELEAYLSGLDDAGELPFDLQLCLKAYVMAGWKQWRAGFAGREL